MATRPIAKKPENAFTKPRRFVDDAEIETKAPESKSWDEYESACKAIKICAKDIQNKLDSLFRDWAAFEAAALQAYKKMPQADAMFSDSPLSSVRMLHAFRQNMAKLGWKWASALPYGPDNVKTFLTIVEEAITWGQRIIRDNERAEKIEAAKKLADKAQDDLRKIT